MSDISAGKRLIQDMNNPESKPGQYRDLGLVENKACVMESVTILIDVLATGDVKNVETEKRKINTI